MGYRTYIGYLPKTNPTPTNLEEFPKQEQTYLELGKYVEWRPPSPDLMEHDSDCEFYIIDWDFLVHIINSYCDKVHEHYQECLQKIKEIKNNKERLLGFLDSHFEEKIRKWARNDILGISRSIVRINKSYDGQITPDWSYEYSVFNLVHILHTHDWEKNHLVYWCK